MEEGIGGILNPSTISLNFDGQSETPQYNRSSYYTPSSQIQIGQSGGNPQIIVGNISNQQLGTFSEVCEQI